MEQQTEPPPKIDIPRQILYISATLKSGPKGKQMRSFQGLGRVLFWISVIFVEKSWSGQPITIGPCQTAPSFEYHREYFSQKVASSRFVHWADLFFRNRPFDLIVFGRSVGAQVPVDKDSYASYDFYPHVFPGLSHSVSAVATGHHYFNDTRIHYTYLGVPGDNRDYLYATEKGDAPHWLNPPTHNPNLLPQRKKSTETRFVSLAQINPNKRRELPDFILLNSLGIRTLVFELSSLTYREGVIRVQGGVDSIHIADLDLDGDSDIVVGLPSPPHGLRIFLNDKGKFQEQLISNQNAFRNSCAKIEIGNFDGDPHNRPDIYCASTHPWKEPDHVYFNTSQNQRLVFKEYVFTHVQNPPFIDVFPRAHRAAAIMNADLKFQKFFPDIAMIQKQKDGPPLFLLLAKDRNRPFQYSCQQYPLRGLDEITDLKIADVDRDGRNDVLIVGDGDIHVLRRVGEIPRKLWPKRRKKTAN